MKRERKEEKKSSVKNSFCFTFISADPRAPPLPARDRLEQPDSHWNSCSAWRAFCGFYLRELNVFALFVPKCHKKLSSTLKLIPISRSVMLTHPVFLSLSLSLSLPRSLSLHPSQPCPEESSQSKNNNEVRANFFLQRMRKKEEGKNNNCSFSSSPNVFVIYPESGQLTNDVK